MCSATRAPLCGESCHTRHRCPHNHWRARCDPHYIDNVELRARANRASGVEPVIVYEDERGGHLQVAVMRVPPQTRVPRETHATLTQWLHIVDGYGAIAIGDDRERPLGPGEAALVPRGVPHTFRNTSDTRDLVLYTLYAKDTSTPRWEH